MFYAPACTARTWHPQRGDVSPSLPAAGFGRLRIDVPVLAHSAVPVEARSSMPPFTLRLRKPALRRVSTAGERSWPASSKRSRNLRPARSVSRSRLRQSPANPAENVPRTKPVAGSDPEIPCVPPGFRSPPGSLDPSGSMPQPGFKQRSLPLRAARFPFAPRYAESILVSPAHRIVVPDSLHPARLAVLRTSWNRPHSAPECFPGQGKMTIRQTLSSEKIKCRINRLGYDCVAKSVDKTCTGKVV